MQFYVITKANSNSNPINSKTGATKSTSIQKTFFTKLINRRFYRTRSNSSIGHLKSLAIKNANAPAKSGSERCHNMSFQNFALVE